MSALGRRRRGGGLLSCRQAGVISVRLFFVPTLVDFGSWWDTGSIFK